MVKETVIVEKAAKKVLKVTVVVEKKEVAERPATGVSRTWRSPQNQRRPGARVRLASSRLRSLYQEEVSQR